MKLLTEDIEYLIDNNLFFEKSEIHTCDLHRVQFIAYFEIRNKISLTQLVENTINRYLDNLKESQRLYELEENFNSLYSKKRYKNNISKEQLKNIKYKFMNSKLYYLDWVIASVKNPYLEYLYLFINSINSSLYIKENQFYNNSVQYNYDNFKNKIKQMIEDAENFNNENKFIDAKLHEGLITIYKENNIEGSILISSLTNKFLYQIFKTLDFDEIEDKDIEIFKRNQFFHKQFEKVNFTENEMYNGFAQACYFNYAQARFQNFKILMKNYNHKRHKTTTIPRFTKDFIERTIIDLFNSILGREQIISIYKIKKSPNILKIYDDIFIYSTKNLSKLDKEFYKFMIDILFDETEKIKKFIKEHEKELREYMSYLRIIFY